VTIQRMLAVVMILGSSVLTAWASGDIAFPAILGMLGLLGTWRRFTWDIRPEKHFVTPLLLLVLAALFALHCHYAHVRADQAAAFAWQTIARYFLASMILLLFLRSTAWSVVGSPTSVVGDGKGPAGNRLPPAGYRLPTTDYRLPACLPPSLGLFHLATAMAAGQVLLLDDRYIAFRVTELLSVILVILYAATAGRLETIGRRPEGQEYLRPKAYSLQPTDYRLPACLAALLLVAVNLGWIGGSLLYRHVEVINFLPAWLSRGTVTLESTTTPVASVGFSTSGKLSTILSIKEDADSTPVLSLTGSNPSYLRAMAFETYSQSAWLDRSYREAILPEQNTPFGGLRVGRTSLFRLHGAGANEDSSLREVTIRHESSIGDAMFTPLGTCSVEAPFSLLMHDDDDIVSSPNVRNRLTYRAAYATSFAGNPPTRDQWRRMVGIPNQLDPRIRQSANRIFRGCTTTAEKIDAVTRYFHTNYTYALGLEVPADRDALNYFLLEASSGYCEYFASGAAVLLRFANVPTRYVTGFLVTEKGDDGRSWVARNMDAHAWAEAWDAQQGQWTIVEATTQEGLGDASLADQLVRGTGSGAPFLRQLMESLYEYGLFGVIGLAWRGPLALASAALVALLAVAVVGRAWGGARARRRGRDAHGTQSRDGLATLHKVLAAVDRKVKAQGWRRGPGETLHAFAGRIGGQALSVVGSRTSVVGTMPPVSSGLPITDYRRPAWIADWYLEYADLRYGTQIDPGRIERLQQLAKKLHAERG
jgi:hypothetical protein